MGMHEAFLPSAEEMRIFDQQTISAGTAALELMERAGKALCNSILRHTTVRMGKEFLILCGPGNNGGDGLVVARNLIQAGIPATIVLVNASHYSEELIHNLAPLSDYRKLYVFSDSADPTVPALSLRPISAADLIQKIKSSRVIVDALLGNSQKGALRGTVKIFCEMLNTHRVVGSKIFALDVPTGVDVDSGRIADHCLSADMTICVQMTKRGLMQYPARACCGVLKTVDIGIQASAPTFFRRLSAESCAHLQRDPAMHKGNAGKVLVIGGSEGMAGAPILSVEAAMAAGAGVLTCFMPSALIGQIPSPRESMVLPAKGEKHFVAADFALIKSTLDSYQAIVVGPGLGRSADTRDFLDAVLRYVTSPVVIDAQALGLLAEIIRSRRTIACKPNWVLTPHPGELATLLQVSSDEIQANRYEAFRHCVQTYDSQCVLKGAGTIVGNRDAGFVQRDGNPFMATAGCGDVLAGVIAGLIAQGMTPRDAAVTGVFVHGRAGDKAFQKAVGPITAREIISAIPEQVFTYAY